MPRILEKHPGYSVSITVVLLNIIVIILLSAHLLNSLQAARSLSQSLGTNLDWYALLRGGKVNLFGPMLVIGMMGVGVLLELGKRPLAALLNPLIPTVGVVVLAVQLLEYPPPGAAGETGIVAILIGFPMLLMAIVYIAIYWSRIRLIIRTRFTLDV